ncbi:MAG: hypothetical protein SVT56_04040 [Chloroflexota bacterium]|jgi:hypothetical protein|nr:hypothetical protein [Chloroflexota bacterium]
MKQKLVPILFILSAFFLFSCGLTDIFMGEETQAVSAPQEGTIAVEEQVESKPTEEIEGPTPTERIKLDTESACYHPLFPVVEGASWNYAYESGEGYTLRIEEASEDTFTMSQTMEGEMEGEEKIVYSVDWYCSEDGLLRGTFGQLELLSESAELEGADFSFETIEWEGETLPASELLEVGYTWTTEYKLSGEMNLEETATTVDVTIVMDYTIGAIEEVTVPARTFPEAVRVDNTSDIEISIAAGEINVPMSTMNLSSSTWYAEGVGMLKTETAFSGSSTDVELVETSLID